MHKIYLAHHGRKGQIWGIRNGPPYPLESRIDQYSKYSQRGKMKFIRTKFPNMSNLEYNRANDLWYTYRERKLPKGELDNVISAFNEYLRSKDELMAIESVDYGNHRYRAVVKGFNNYKIFDRTAIPGVSWDLDDILAEAVDPYWRDL